MDEPDMQEKWYNLCKHFTQDANKIEQAWRIIFSAYHEAHRAYHTLDHIAELTQRIEECSDKIKDKFTLLFTAFYHDIVYIPGSNVNEKESSMIAVEGMKELQVPIEIANDTKKLILHTKSHAHVDASVTPDMLLFLDMDLAIIGAEPDRYEQYRVSVRKEFNATPDFLFRKEEAVF